MAFAQNLFKSTYLIKRIAYSFYRNYSSVDPLVRSLGKKVLKKGENLSNEITLEVETDANILVNYVCGTNLFQDKGENVKIKPDSEYPEWLWTLHIGKPKTLDEMDPNTLEYWRKVRKLGCQQEQLINRLFKEKQDHK